MECLRCNTKLMKVQPAQDYQTSIPLAIQTGKIGLFGLKKTNTMVLSAYVCKNCGYAELHADEYEKLENWHELEE